MKINAFVVSAKVVMLFVYWNAAYDELQATEG